ncbi:hypothetical protein ACDY96_09015 [Rhizobium mongolense]|uniref:hypothetical protein n=1 Tax=Rhizobium mongolense TaxID=57676 RepID=UPI0035579BA1
MGGAVVATHAPRRAVSLGVFFWRRAWIVYLRPTITAIAGADDFREFAREIISLVVCDIA